MNSSTTPSTLADRFAWLFAGVSRALDSEAAKGRMEAWLCGGGWGWIAAPVALLMRMRARRRRNEAELVVEQLKLLMQEFVAALRQAAEEKAAATPEPQAHGNVGETAVTPPGEPVAPPRSSAISAGKESEPRRTR
jgi:hypothetical protein